VELDDLKEAGDKFFSFLFQHLLDQVIIAVMHKVFKSLFSVKKNLLYFLTSF